MRTLGYCLGAAVEGLAWCWQHKRDLAGLFVLIALLIEVVALCHLVAALDGWR